jgi:lysozyme
MNYVLLFAFLRRKKREWARTSAGLSQAEVDEFSAVLKEAEAPAEQQPQSLASGLQEEIKSSGLSNRRGPLAAIVGTIAATSLFASVPKEEGTEYKAYRDIAGIWTVCQGDTKDVHPGLIETPEGCRQRLETQLVAHAKPVMACTPALSEPGRDYQRAAAVSLAYNIGVGAWCRSTADRLFDSGDWKGGCDAFLAYSKARVHGQLRTVQGLLSRRQRERVICLKGIA